jgi:hypothetical protein
MSSTVGLLGTSPSAAAGKAAVNNTAVRRNKSNGLNLCFTGKLSFLIINLSALFGAENLLGLERLWIVVQGRTDAVAEQHQIHHRFGERAGYQHGAELLLAKAFHIITSFSHALKEMPHNMGSISLSLPAGGTVVFQA